MPVHVSFDFYGDVQLDRTLERFAAHADDATPAFEAMAERFQTAERRQFRSQGAASGGWTPLSPRYAAWKAVHYPGKTILRRTDRLFRSLTERPFGIERIEPHDAWFGSDVPYGAFHQHGGGHLPRRRPVELTEVERRAWVKILQRFIVTGQTSAHP